MRSACLFLFLVLVPALGFAICDDEVANLINGVGDLNKGKLGSPGCDCDGKPLQRVSTVCSTASSASPEAQVPEYTTFKDPWKKDVKVSVLTEEQAMELFKNISRKHELAPKNAAFCQERAHKIGFELENAGVESGKLFAEISWSSYAAGYKILPNHELFKDKGNVEGWNLHAASFVYVKKGGKLEQWVFDPALFNRPVPRSEWDRMMTSNPSSASLKITETNRFIFQAKDKNQERTGYDYEEFKRMNDRLRRGNTNNTGYVER